MNRSAHLPLAAEFKARALLEPLPEGVLNDLYSNSNQQKQDSTDCNQWQRDAPVFNSVWSLAW